MINRGIIIVVLIFVFFKDNVGMRLVSKYDTTHIQMLQKACERKTVSASTKSKVIKTGIRANAAAAGAGTPVK